MAYYKLKFRSEKLRQFCVQSLVTDRTFPPEMLGEMRDPTFPHEKMRDKITRILKKEVGLNDTAVRPESLDRWVATDDWKLIEVWEDEVVVN